MESAINKVFEYFDGMFFEERVEIDGWGKYGAHYQGLILTFRIQFWAGQNPF